MDIPCFIYNLLRRKQRKMDMEKSSVQPQVVIKVNNSYFAQDIFKIVETGERKALLVKTRDEEYVCPGEIHILYSPAGSMLVSKTNRPLKLECFPLESSPPSTPVKMNPVGVTYDLLTLFHFEEVTVLNRPGPIEIKNKYVGDDPRPELVFETPVPELSTPYQMEKLLVYAEASWNDVDYVKSQLPGYNLDPPLQCQLAENTPVCYLGFSFLNDQGEWEPLKDFELEFVNDWEEGEEGEEGDENTLDQLCYILY
jgi:hypothetical protein